MTYQEPLGPRTARETEVEMRIGNRLSTLLANSASTYTPRVLPWRAGAVLSAMVVGPVAPGVTRLRIGDVLIDAENANPLPAGTVLKMRVRQGGEQPVLEPMGTAEYQAPTAAMTRRLLPLQDGWRRFLQAVLGKAANPASTPGHSDRAAGAAQRLLEHLPVLENLSHGAGLARALRDSGLFYEARLANGEPAAVVRDLKGDMLALRNALSSASAGEPPVSPPPETRPDASPRQSYVAPPERGQAPVAEPPVLPPQTADLPSASHLLHDLDAALARLQLSQLASVPAPGSPPVWLFELPLVSPQNTLDLAKLRVERDPDGGGADAKGNWRVQLNLWLAELGPVQARIVLSGGRVSIAFWLEQGGRVQGLRDALPLLSHRLEQQGMLVGNLSCQAGCPERDNTPRAPVLETRA